MSPLYTEDNLNFLGLDAARIGALRRVSSSVVNECEKLLDRPNTARRTNVAQADDSDKFRFAYEIIKLVFKEVVSPSVTDSARQFKEININSILDNGFSRKIQNLLRSIDFETRIFFYLMWRAIVMNSYTIHQDGKIGRH